MSGRASCFRLKNIFKKLSQKLAQVQKTLYLCILINQPHINVMSLEKVRNQAAATLAAIDKDIERHKKLINDDFDRAWSGGALEELKKQRIRRDFYVKLLEVSDVEESARYVTVNQNTRQFLELTLQEISAELSRGNFQGHSSNHWHNLSEVYRMEVRAQTLSTIHHFLKLLTLS